MPRYPDLLCKVNTISPKFIQRYVEWLPKEECSIEALYEHVANYVSNFQNNHKQACLQWGLYYEEDGVCHMRFNRNITMKEANEYLQIWLKNAVIPNPYSKLRALREPQNLIKLFVEYMKRHPEVKYLQDIADGACHEKTNSRLDILKNTLEQTGMFKFTDGPCRYFRIAKKHDWEKKLQAISNKNELESLVSCLKESDVLGDVTKRVYGEAKTFDELQHVENFDKVLKIEKVKNITTSLVDGYESIYKKYTMTNKEYFDLFNEAKTTNFDPNMPLQQITYGAPGTGKSFKIMRDTAGKSIIRTTFHPDTDYSTFVGAYKPVMEEVEMHVVPVVLNNGASFDQNKGSLKEKRISYKFVKQAFLKAYLGAWKKYTEADGEAVDPQFLIIEEINRGNCAQIFGDLFQLLDRNDKNKFSVYPIEADADLQKEIKHAFTEEYDGGNDNPYKLDKNIEIEGAVDGYFSNFGATLSEDIQEGRVLLLPPNLYIWATMNTSDQSLFPIDSAFKRRWDWKYIKIKEGKDDEGNNLDWKIAIDGKKINGQESLSWWTFVQKINEIIASMTSSADKQLGYFFCKAKDGVISGETFVSKVIFYLWNDVFKDYGFEDASLFRYETIEDGKTVEKDLTFPDFYDEDGENVNGDRVVNFLEKVLAWHTPNDNA